MTIIGLPDQRIEIAMQITPLKDKGLGGYFTDGKSDGIKIFLQHLNMCWQGSGEKSGRQEQEAAREQEIVIFDEEQRMLCRITLSGHASVHGVHPNTFR